MITIQTGCTLPLPCGVNDIKGFTINCCDFFFLDRSGCKLIKWTKCTQAVETIALNQRYLCLCYDPAENCYWGISECEPCLIYRLDACFCEVGHFAISGAYQQRPTGICSGNCESGIWVCYPFQLAFMEKFGGKVTWHKNEDSRKINLGVLIQCECRVNCCYEGNRQVIEVLPSCGQESIELCVPKDYKFVGMVSCPCKVEARNCRFCLLLSKRCAKEFMLAEYSVDFSQGLIKPCCPCQLVPCPPNPCPHPCLHHCGGSYEIMHSIALEEAGISHILNAEGEKIQKAVAISNNIDDLICVNESVKRTLTQVTLLEGMLYSKLEALASCEDFCHATKPPCPSPLPPVACCDSGGCNEPDFCN